MTEERKRNNVSTHNKRRMRKIFSLFALVGMTSIILVVSTYAWFIGTTVATTSTFDISISTEETLLLSIDGETWSTSLTLSQTDILEEAYDGNTNHWVGTNGLAPVSTNGVINSTSSRLTLYEKTSLTATPGGYRLLADTIDNSSAAASGGGLVAESDSYVVFDLFIKNGNRGQFYEETYNASDNEALYLLSSSTVVAVPQGGGNDYGLANSVRVAFAQIGRVNTNSSAAVATAITCASSEQGAQNPVTGLCSNAGTTIWEPNDSSHSADLVTYFNSVCKKRTISGQNPGYGSESCDALTTSTHVSTFVVKEPIDSSDNVDIYDGLNDVTVGNDYKLVEQVAFTDTQKVMTGSSRPAFMFLAPNSITKIRVYIYLEGQDVDNYDLITNGEKIRVNFGFTKDQLDIASQNSNNNNGSGNGE